MTRPPRPLLGYSALTGTVYVLKRNGQKEAVPENQLVSVISGWLDDHDLIVNKDGFRVRYGVEEILPLGDEPDVSRPDRRGQPRQPVADNRGDQ